MVLWATVALAISVDEVPNPRSHQGWITDEAAILHASAETELEALLEALHADTGAEVALVTLSSVSPATPKQFATGLFQHWGIGDANANNGLLVLLVMDERRLEMETGYGLEAVLPDAWLGRMQRESMVPAFKEGDFAGGLVAGLDAIDIRLRADPETVREGTRGEVYTGQPGEPGMGGTQIAAIGGAGALGTFGALGLGGLLWRDRRRKRTCPECAVYMPMLDPFEEVDHLDEGQQMEEAIGSVDWQVHLCPECAFVRTFRKGRWFSGYSQCPECVNKTRSTSTTTLEAATEYSGGLVEVDEGCAHCDYSNTYTRSTPRISRPSSGGSGGSGGGGGSGGSFGGGSSGGGGAGSSW